AKIGAAALHEPNALGQRRRRGIFLGRTMQKIKSSVGATHSQTMRGAVRGEVRVCAELELGAPFSRFMVQLRALLGLLILDQALLAAAINHDPSDQPFRRAPMAESSRSIVIPLATNLHLAFDAQCLRTHTVWTGAGLNLLGPPYTGQKSPFLCNFNGQTLWGNPPVFPWRIGRRAQKDPFERPESARFEGTSTKGGAITLMYELAMEQGKAVQIFEAPRREMIGNMAAVVRRFQISPCDQDLFYLANAAMNQGWLLGDLKSAMTVQMNAGYLTLILRGNGPLEWAPNQQEVDYLVLLQMEKDGKGPDSAVKTNRVVGME